jgi:hypothetical protein
MISWVVSSPNGSPDWIGLDNGILLEMVRKGVETPLYRKPEGTFGVVQTEPECVIEENNDVNNPCQTV